MAQEAPCLTRMIEHLKERLVQEGRVDLSVRVRPHAAASRVTGVLEDGSVKVAIAAPAEEGRGNEALIRLLAQEFSVDRSHVTILAGHTGRRKLVRIVV